MKLLAASGLIAFVLPAAYGAAPAIELATAQPERWVHVGGTANVYEEYLDRKSITPSGNRVAVWTRRDFAREQATEWHELEFGCLTGTETVLAWVRDQRGTVSHNESRPHREASPIQPGSAADRIFGLVCR